MASERAGGKTLAGGLQMMLADIRKAAAETHEQIKQAADELKAEIQNGPLVVRALREEAAHVRASFGEMLGNNPPESNEQEPPGERG